MLPLPDYFIYIGSLVMLIGAGIYVVQMFRGEAKPSKVTWGFWGLVGGIIFASSLSAGGGVQTGIALAGAAGPLAIFVLSFFIKQSFWKTTKFDLTIGAVAMLSLVLWFITKQPLIALALSILADLLATIPTFVKSYKDPDSESALSFSLGAIGPMLVLLTISDWKAASFAYPMYVFIADSLIVAVVLNRRSIQNK